MRRVEPIALPIRQKSALPKMPHFYEKGRPIALLSGRNKLFPKYLFLMKKVSL